MTDYKALAKNVAPFIRALMENGIAGKTTTQLLAAEEIEEKALQTDLAYIKPVLPWESAVHPDNRKKSGVEPCDVQALCQQFIKNCFGNMIVFLKFTINRFSNIWIQTLKIK